MTKEIALHCMKSASELEKELCEECPIYGQTGSDHCYEDALQYVIKTLEQEPEPVYFPPCVDCQERSKEILTAYNNMKKMQTFTKEEVITMLDKIRAEIKALSPEPTAYDVIDGNPIKDAVWETIADVLKIIDKHRAESEGDKE